ncbi:MAG: BTAD domain-containing putative transcriptional regulator [Solirubrobacteraceae bacterium]
MKTSIRLLGSPAIVADGRPVPAPKGRKAWALLAYLLLSEGSPSRRRLAELLFADADDPLGALRWNLAQLRRALDGVATIEGDPVELVLAPDVAVDVRDLAAADGELLEGMEFGASPAFESWLLVTRGRYAGQAAAALHDTALDELAAGNADRAAELAARLVALDPFDEAHHELLVRSLAARGDRAGALAQAEACSRLFRRELGVEPSPAVRRAAGPAAEGEPVAGNRGAARAHLEGGTAAVGAGAVEHGVGLLRQACAEALACGDGVVHARSLLALGSALVHAVRGRDEEGSLFLHEAIAAAEAAGDRETLVGALRELAYTDIQAGRRSSVEQRLARADRLANGHVEHAAILAVQGMNRSDMADYPGAFAALARSIEHAERSGDRRQAAFSLSLLGRARLLRGESAEATVALDRALELIEAERWLAFLPFPEAMRGEIDLERGDTARAAERFERAFAMACDLQDPCWEGLAARNLALLHRAHGQTGSTRSWMDEARARCTRLPDRYVWMHGHVLDAAIRIDLDAGPDERTAQLIGALRALAARTEMRELVVRSLVHAARMGDRGALDSARMLAAEIDNPALASLIEGHF